MARFYESVANPIVECVVVIHKRCWPFEVPARDKLSPEGKWFVAFLETANNEGWNPYMIEDSVVGADSKSGRSGEIVRRGGGGRWWEIILAENHLVSTSKYVDGFEQSAAAVLSWLRGEEMEAILQRIQCFLIERPRGLRSATDVTDVGLALNQAPNAHPENV